jgi:hypothetical protein
MTYFWQIFNTNLDKIVQKFFFLNLKIFLKTFFENIPRTFPEKKSPKGVPVAPISPFAPTYISLHGY